MNNLPKVRGINITFWVKFLAFAIIVVIINDLRINEDLDRVHALRRRGSDTSLTNIESMDQLNRSNHGNQGRDTKRQTILGSICDIEQKHTVSAECDAFGGSTFIKNLQDSDMSLLTKTSSSKLKSYRSNAMDIFLAEHVSIVVNNINDDQKREFVLEVDGHFLDMNSRSRIDISKDIGDSKLRNMTINIQERADGMPECREYFDYPVMLIDDNVDTWNWWFFLISVLKHYIMLTVVENQVMRDFSKGLRVLSTLNDAADSRPFTDIFDIMFAPNKHRWGNRQIWKESPVDRFMAKGSDSISHRYCFRTLVWSPGGTQGGNHILINRSHDYSKCFSSIIYSYATHVKTMLRLPSLPRPDVPRVVWVARDTSPEANPTQWQSQRIINNQDEVISYLKEQCGKSGIELIVASFYGDKKDTAAREQAHFVSRANIMIGIHGAGLNMFHFMPFYSVVVELHLGTSAQKNSANYVNHIHEAKYFGVHAKVKSRDRHNVVALDEKATWETLNDAIVEWTKLLTIPVTTEKEN